MRMDGFSEVTMSTAVPRLSMLGTPPSAAVSCASEIGAFEAP